MSELEELDVTLELPASEMMEHDGGIFVRRPVVGGWVPMHDYYSEVEGQLLPLVGRVDYVESKEQKDNPSEWKEVVRILPKVEQNPEGGNISFNAGESVGMGDKMV